jgi:hypothetical protein
MIDYKAALKRKAEQSAVVESGPTVAEVQTDAQSEAGGKMAGMEREERTLPVKPTGFDLEVTKKHFAVYLDQIKGKLARARELVIKDDATFAEASELSLWARKLAKEIEAKREGFVKTEEIKQVEKYVKDVRAFCKMFIEDLERIQTEADRKWVTYKTLKEQERREQEERERKAREKLQEKVNRESAKMGVAPVELPPAAVPSETSTVRTEHGSIHTREYWTFVVQDIEKVPIFFLTASGQKMQIVGVLDSVIRDLIKAGVRTIPGIKIFRDDKTVKRVA